MKQTMQRVLTLLAVVALVMTALPVMTVSAAYENTHVNTGDQAADIVAVAMTQVGYLEGSLAGTTAGSNNLQKYGQWYDNNVDNIGVTRAAWCAAFVSWCANQAGIPSSTVYYHAYCPFGVTWFKNQGLFQYSASRGGSYTPKAGDIIYFQSSTEASHVGIVRYVSGGRVYTVEGNTSGQNGEVNEGGGVFAKSYDLTYGNILGYGTPNYETSPGAHADKLGTYRITASSLNVRSSASTNGTVVGELANGALVVVTELSSGWGKVTLSDGTVGWCAIGDYGQYIGVDALDTDITAAWGGENLAIHTNANGSVTLTNSGAEAIAVDLPLPLKLGNKTTPSMNVSVSVNRGGWYFGITQAGTGYFMMRDCSAGDELVNTTTVPFMTTDEQLQIDVGYWWAPEENYQIDDVRFYLNADSSVTVNYCYFAAQSGVVTDTTYNMRKGGTDAPVVTVPDPVDLMLPDTLDIVDRNKSGYYNYQNGTLTVVSLDANGYEVSFAPYASLSIAELKNLVFSVDTDTAYDIELLVTTSDGDRVFSLADDFAPMLGGEIGDDYVPARNGSAALDLYSCYTWNNIVPADGITTVKAVVVRVAGEGTVVVNEIQMAANDVLTYFADNVQKSDSSVPVLPPPPVFDNGDVNGDGTVSTVDARLIISHLLGESTLSDEQIAVADFDGNGTVSTADVRAILTSVLS